jgi:hypothetical protein
MSYIGADDLVFNNKDGICSGGFNVQSIMMKGGISPIMTINNNNNQNGGTIEKVSDIFQGLVIPAYAYHNNYQIQNGGKQHKYKTYDSDNDSDSDSHEDVINEDLHDKLLQLMNEHENKIKQNKKKSTRKNGINKKNNTKKNKVNK